METLPTHTEIALRKTSDPELIFQGLKIARRRITIQSIKEADAIIGQTGWVSKLAEKSEPIPLCVDFKHIKKWFNKRYKSKSIAKIKEEGWREIIVMGLAMKHNGFGQKKTAEILGVPRHYVKSLLSYFSMAGVSVDAVERQRKDQFNRETLLKVKMIGGETSKEAIKAVKAYESTVMNQYKKDLRSFPDWRSLWWPDQYGKMTPEQKKKHNRKTWLARKGCPKALKRRKQWRERRTGEQRMRHNMQSQLAGWASKRARGSCSRLFEYIGIAPEEFKRYIENQFVGYMNWDNYGKIWHIDHIVPSSYFNHDDKEEVKRCWNWQNLRPLYAKKNIRRGNRVGIIQAYLPISI